MNSQGFCKPKNSFLIISIFNVLEAVLLSSLRSISIMCFTIEGHGCLLSTLNRTFDTDFEGIYLLYTKHFNFNYPFISTVFSS